MSAFSKEAFHHDGKLDGATLNIYYAGGSLIGSLYYFRRTRCIKVYRSMVLVKNLWAEAG